MIPFTLSLLAEVEVYLTEVREGNYDVITNTKKTFVKLRESCDQVTQRLHHYEFQNLEEEIRFFKEIKPLLFSKLIYSKYIFKLEVNKPLGSEEIKRAYFIKYLNKLAKFFEENEEFFNYLHNKDSNFDDKYFTKCKSLNNSSSFLKHEELELIRFSSHDISIARIIAYKQVEEYIIDELRKSIAISEQVSDSEKWRKLKGLQLRWTAPTIDLIELIYGLHRKKCVNNGDIEIKTMVEAAEILFGITIKDVYRVYSDIKSRHHRTKFLDSLRDTLDRSIEEDDS